MCNIVHMTICVSGPLFSFHSRCGSRGPDSDSCGPDSSVCEDPTVLQTQYVTLFMCGGCRNGIRCSCIVHGFPGFPMGLL